MPLSIAELKLYSSIVNIHCVSKKRINFGALGFRD